MDKGNLYDRGVELYEEERFGEAIKVLLNAHADDPEDIDVIELLAECYIKIAHFTNAAKLLLDAYGFDHGNPTITYNLGYALLCMGRLNDAMKYMKKCLRLNPPREIKKMAKRMIKSKEYFAEKLENNYDISLKDEFESEKKFLRAQKHLYANEFKEAIALYNSILKKKPDFHQAIQNIGVCYIQDENPRKALKYFERALIIFPKDGICLGNLAHAHFLLGDFEKSREYSEKAMDATKKPLLRDLIRLITLFIDISQLEFARKLLTEYSDVYDNAQLTFLSGVIYAKQKEYLVAKEEFQSIRRYSKIATEYFEKTKQIIEGKIKEYNFGPKLAIELSEDMI